MAPFLNLRWNRALLGVSVCLSEAEVHWREFLGSLQERGLHGVKLIVSDDHAGLKAAREARFAAVPWQRCQFHLAAECRTLCPASLDAGRSGGGSVRDP